MKTIGFILAIIICLFLLGLWFLCFLDTNYENIAEMLFAPYVGWHIGNNTAKFYKWYLSKLK